MFYKLTLLCCFVLNPLFADKVAFVEFQLPESAKDWQVGNKIENEKVTTLIFIPKEVPRLESGEFFGVSANKYKTDLTDLDELKKSVTTQFPEKKVEFTVLEKDENSVIYEWKVMENDQERIHGWGRVFSNDEGTVLLTYMTEKASDVEKSRKIWLPALKAAKVHAKPYIPEGKDSADESD